MSSMVYVRDRGHPVWLGWSWSLAAGLGCFFHWIGLTCVGAHTFSNYNVILAQLSFDEYEVTFFLLFYFWLEIYFIRCQNGYHCLFLGSIFFLRECLFPSLDPTMMPVLGGEKDGSCFLIQSASLCLFVGCSGSGTRVGTGSDPGEGLKACIGFHKISYMLQTLAGGLHQAGESTQVCVVLQFYSICQWKLWAQDGDWIWPRIRSTATLGGHTFLHKHQTQAGCSHRPKDRMWPSEDYEDDTVGLQVSIPWRDTIPQQLHLN